MPECAANVCTRSATFSRCPKCHLRLLVKLILSFLPQSVKAAFKADIAQLERNFRSFCSCCASLSGIWCRSIDERTPSAARASAVSLSSSCSRQVAPVNQMAQIFVSARSTPLSKRRKISTGEKQDAISFSRRFFGPTTLKTKTCRYHGRERCPRADNMLAHGLILPPQQLAADLRRAWTVMMDAVGVTCHDVP